MHLSLLPFRTLTLAKNLSDTSLPLQRIDPETRYPPSAAATAAAFSAAAARAATAAAGPRPSSPPLVLLLLPWCAAPHPGNLWAKKFSSVVFPAPASSPSQHQQQQEHQRASE